MKNDAGIPIRVILLEWEENVFDLSHVERINFETRQNVEAEDGVDFFIVVANSYGRKIAEFRYNSEEYRAKRYQDLKMEMKKLGVLFLNEITLDELTEMIKAAEEERKRKAIERMKVSGFDERVD